MGLEWCLILYSSRNEPYSWIQVLVQPIGHQPKNHNYRRVRWTFPKPSIIKPSSKNPAKVRLQWQRQRLVFQQRHQSTASIHLLWFYSPKAILLFSRWAKRFSHRQRPLCDGKHWTMVPEHQACEIWGQPQDIESYRVTVDRCGGGGQRQWAKRAWHAHRSYKGLKSKVHHGVCRD